jgi:hypothetical protein
VTLKHLLCGLCFVGQEVQGIHHEHDAPRAAQMPLKALPHPWVPWNVHQVDECGLASALSHKAKVSRRTSMLLRAARSHRKFS